MEFHFPIGTEVRNIYVGWEGRVIGSDPEDGLRTLVRYSNGEIHATLTTALESTLENKAV